MTSTADGSSLFTALWRALGLTLLIVGAGLALAFAFAAALVVGVLILGAMVANRFVPRRRAKADGDVLEARATPDGWVVETRAQRTP